MHLIQQKLHRYLGEAFTLSFKTPLPEDAVTGVGELRIGIRTFVADTSVEDGLATTQVAVPASLDLSPGHYPFWLDLVVNGDVTVVAAGVVKFDRKELNDG